MPRWNEILDFALVADNPNSNFTPDELYSATTMIIVSLYDKQAYESQKDGQTVIQEEHRFLGAVSIPLQSILTNPGKCDFNFRLHRPLLLPSYKVTNDELYFLSAQELEM